MARSNAHFRWWTKRTWWFSARSLQTSTDLARLTLITVCLPLVVVEEAVVAVTPRCKKRAWLPRLKRPRPSNRRAVGVSLEADSRKKPTPGMVQQNHIISAPGLRQGFLLRLPARTRALYCAMGFVTFGCGAVTVLSIPHGLRVMWFLLLIFLTF